MQLTIHTRESKTAEALRREGMLPAVMYGRKEPSTPIAVAYKDFEKVFHEAGESTVITLQGLGADKEALIHAVAVDPVLDVPVHADFYVIEKGQTVSVSVPFVFEGVSPAVKDLGGILVKVMRELDMEVLPKDLPHAIVVDISTLENINDQIQIKDLLLPQSAKISIDKDEVVAMISIAQEEPEEPVAMDISQIEVQERGKKEEEVSESTTNEHPSTTKS